MQPSDARAESAKPKTVFDLKPEDRARRGMSFARGALSLSFVMFMSFPIINMFLGTFLLIALVGRLLALSAQRGKDLLWLLLGAGLCMAGWALPLVLGHGTTEFSAFGLLLEAVLNFGICRFIVLGPLAHLVFFESAKT